MSFLPKIGRVAPSHDGEQKERQEHQEQCRDVVDDGAEWGQGEVKPVPWWVIALAALLAAAVVVGVTVGCVCGIHGCPAKSTDTQVESSPLRLVVQFDLSTIDALDLVPAILKPYTSRIKLDSSLLQILSFDTEDVLRKVQPYLQANSSVTLLVRDYVMALTPKPSSLYNTLDNTLDTTQLLSDASAADLAAVLEVVDQTATLTVTAGRRLHQTVTQSVVNDPLVVNRTQWHHTRVNSQGAWTAAAAAGASSGPPIIVAVIDTGFDVTHPDLAGRLWVNKAEIPGNGIDDDGNGYIDDVNGFAFGSVCEPDEWGSGCVRCIDTGSPAAVATDLQHGTHVAGLVGAAVNNSQGGSGMAVNVQLMLLKVTDCTGATTAATIVRAMDYAAQMGAHLVSVSFSDALEDIQRLDGKLPSQPTVPPAPDVAAAYQDRQSLFTIAAKPLAERGTLLVVAAGNYGLSVDGLLSFKYTNAPCTVQLPNVLCVAATNANDTQAFFSNYGSQQVHLSSPGANTIWSTWGVAASGSTPAQHVYAGRDGTSQATPITSGVAAMVTAVLGAVDYNYYRAEQVKQILLDSGDIITALQGKTVTGRRTNALAAVQLAVSRRQAYSKTALSLSPISSPTASLMTTLSTRALVSGFTETYWTNRNAPALLDTAGQRLLEQRVRPTGAAWAGWAAVPSTTTGGNVVELSAHVLISGTGLCTWTVTYLGVTTQAKSRVFVNGRGLTPFSGTSTFYAASPGWYRVAVLLLPAFSTSSGVTVTLALPAAGGTTSGTPVPLNLGAFKLVAGTEALPVLDPPVTTNSYSDPRLAWSWGVTSAYQVVFNRTTTTALDTTARNAYTLAQAATPTSTWQSQVLVADLDIAPGNMQPALLPAGDASTTLYGLAFAFLNTEDMPSSILLQVTCQLCRVSLNGVLVFELWDNLASVTSVTKTSSCVTIQPGLSGSQSYRLEVVWAARKVSTAGLLLKWAPCDGSAPFRSFNGVSPQRRASLSPAVISTAPTSSQATKLMGWVGGVQCDIWLPDSTTSSGTTVPSTPPLYKVRLPRCTSPELSTSRCSSLWSFSVDSLVPNLPFNPADFYTVRCWTYTNASLPALLAAATGPEASGIPTALHFAGVPRYVADVGGVSLQAQVPASYRYGSTLQQVVAVWAGIYSSTTLLVTGNGKPLNITLSAFKLPLWVVPQPGGVDFGSPSPCGSSLNTLTTPCDALLAKNPVGLPGVAVRAYTGVNTADVTSIVASDLSQVSVASITASSSGIALSTSSSTPTQLALPFTSTTAPTTKAWYAVTEGYLAVIMTTPGWVTLVSDEPAATSTLVLCGDVVLRNAPAYSSSAAAVAGVQVQVWLPSGYLRLRLVTKLKPLASGAQGVVQYNWRVRFSNATTLFPATTARWSRIA